MDAIELAKARQAAFEGGAAVMKPYQLIHELLAEIDRLNARQQTFEGTNGRHMIEMDDYEVINLRSALEAVGYNNWDGVHPGQLLRPRSPLDVLHSGDWVGQLHQKLPTNTGHQQPNQTPEKLVEMALAWKPQ